MTRKSRAAVPYVPATPGALSDNPLPWLTADWLRDGAFESEATATLAALAANPAGVSESDRRRLGYALDQALGALRSTVSGLQDTATPYTVRLGSPEGTAYTANEARLVEIGSGPLLDPRLTPGQRAAVMAGLVFHEVGHVRLTRSLTPVVRREVHPHIPTPEGRAVVATVANVLEDVRTEAIDRALFPGLAPALDAVLRWVGDRSTAQAGGRMIRQSAEWRESRTALLVASLRFPWISDFADTEAERDWLREAMGRALVAPSLRALAAIIREVSEWVLEAPSAPPPPLPEPPTEDGEDEDPDESEDEDEDGPDGGCGPSIPSAPDEDEDESPPPSGSGSDEDEDPEDEDEDSDPGEGDEDESEDEDSEDESGGESDEDSEDEDEDSEAPSGSDEDEDSDEGDESDGEDSEDEGDESDEGEDEDEDSGEDSDSDEDSDEGEDGEDSDTPSGDEDSDSEDSDADSEDSASEDEDSANWSAMPEGCIGDEARVHGTDEAAQTLADYAHNTARKVERSRRYPTPMGTWDKGGVVVREREVTARTRHGSASSFVAPGDWSPEVDEDEGEDVDEWGREWSDAEAKVAAGSGDISRKGIRKTPRTRGRYSPVTVNPLVTEDRVEAGAALAGAISSARRGRQAPERGCRTGRLDRGRLARVANHDPRVFVRREALSPERVRAYVLLDCSGSMYEAKYEYSPDAGRTSTAKIVTAAQVCRDLAVALDSIPWTEARLYAHTTDAEGPYVVPLWRKGEDRERVSDVFSIPAAGNHDGYAISYVADDLLAERAISERALLIVVSDGMPAGPPVYVHGNSHTKAAVDYYRRKGVRVVSVSIDPALSGEGQRDLYGEDVVDYDPNPAALARNLARVIGSSI